MKIKCRNKILDLNSHTHIMGILNCTPDSFYSGSRNYSVDSAVERGIRMTEEGADILDIGGESTRPGARPISVEEESARVLPVIEKLLRQVDVVLSVDTTKSVVAQLALESGAHMVNDISGLQFDPELANVVANFGVPVIIMHIKGAPQNMQKNPTYENVLGEICEYFAKRIDYATSEGIDTAKIILDPGIGFGKRLDDNYEIINNLVKFTEFGRPILVGPSRKSFIGRVLNLPPEESLEGTLAMATAAILNGAQILRVHDVQQVKRAALVTDYLSNLKRTHGNE